MTQNQTSMLDTILSYKRKELSQRPLGGGPTRRTRPMHDFRAALARPGVSYILECKRRSPSNGKLRAELSIETVADAYRGIADAVSVLTDEHFFGGSLADLATLGERLEVPLLRKDFIIDASQVHESWLHGADAVLLMLSALSDDAWRECVRQAKRCGIAVLTEVHDEDELERALMLDAGTIGINNRSFRDLSVNLDVTRRLAPRIPANRVRVCESGIDTAVDIRRLAANVDAFLVGSSLMRAERIDLAARTLAFGKTKICGLTRAEDARIAWLAGACYGGLVFAEKSPRNVTLEQARDIRMATPAMPLVGVFVNDKPARIAAHAKALDLAAVQLHGNETEHDIAELRTLIPKDCAIWKAVRVEGNIPSRPGNADLILLDSRVPGSGEAFDWSVLDGMNLAAFGLAGGIGADNIAAALSLNPGLIDVSSGVEKMPGIKCEKRIVHFFEAIRMGLRMGTKHGAENEEDVRC